jgi:peptidase E
LDAKGLIATGYRWKPTGHERRPGNESGGAAGGIYTRPVPGHVLASGGALLGTPLDDLVLQLGGPRVCLVPTAGGESAERVVAFYEAFAGRADPSHVVFNPWPRADLREHVLTQDVIYVTGGNTANALAVWRVHGFDALLREAWEQGALLCGASAGMICWFEAGVTDSFGPQLEGMRDGLGFLPGSGCPHYDGEERRRPVYTELVASGFPPGYAADDGAALHFVGTELHEVVAVTEGAGAYRVEPGSETPLPTRLL